MASSERTEETFTSSASASPAISSTPTFPTNEEDRSSRTPTAAIDALRIDLLMNARYHASREAFLDTVHRLLMFGVIVLGAAAIVDLFPDEHKKNLSSIFAACTVVLAALDLTFDLSNRARCHALMKRRYFELIADLLEGKREIEEVQGCMNRYCADEEPAYHALIAISWNAAQEMVYGEKSDAYEIPPVHRLLKNLLRFGRKYPVTLHPNN
jgi:hypothetical protein